MAEPMKTPRGRPTKPTAERRRNNQVVRLRDATHEALKAAADQNQRSVSEEMEYRIEQSLAQESDDDGMLGRVVAQVALSSRHKNGCSWPDDKVFATYLYTRLCIVLAAKMGVPVMSGTAHDINFTVPGFEPTSEMLAERKAAADLAWAEERGEVKRPSFAEMVERYR